MNERTMTDDVRDQYAEVARGQLSNDSTAVRSIASAFGYSAEQLNQLPAEANMGLSCGNPLALAAIREGEVVVDLGCGGGMDVFLAARLVGSSGRAIGIDMTPEMLQRARAGQQKLGLDNVEFYQASIDHLPLPDNSVDCVISNCVINLAPDKSAVFREILRVLKPGGRVAISDIALKQPLPPHVKKSVEAYVGCIAGAVLIAEYRNMMQQAGFGSVVVTDTGADLNAYAVASESGCCGGGCDGDGADSPTVQKSLHDGLASVMQTFDANAYAASVKVHAIKSMSPKSINIVPVLNVLKPSEEKTMKTVQVYDKPMCCSTGICGPEVDPVLPKFAADLDWLKTQGHQVERFNLAQQPQAFIDNKSIHQLLSTTGTDCLPVIVVDGKVVSQCKYPSREDFSAWIDGTAPTKPMLPVSQAGGGCCGTTGCC
jgi:ubiquinone/menaquinone biosynthesis C-methylase UbiE